MKKILILNSYRLVDKPPLKLVRIRSFLKGLEEEGFIKDKDYAIEIIDSNDLNELKVSLIEKLKNDTIDLIHTVGTPNADLAARVTSDKPIVYYGAHPQDAGRKECSQNNICGMELALPFTANYKNFRIVRKIFPGVKNVYVPFYEGTIFCLKELKERHTIFRKVNRGSGWVSSESEYIGYTSLSGLCYTVGLNYYEALYRDSDELNTLLNLMDTKNSLLMPYNDTVYCKNAPEILLEGSKEKRVPLLWNNNHQATQAGAVAAITGCFKEAGSYTGRIAGKILRGAEPSQFPLQKAMNSYASVNLKNASNIGIEIQDQALEYFDEVLR